MLTRMLPDHPSEDLRVDPQLAGCGFSGSSYSFAKITFGLLNSAAVTPPPIPTATFPLISDVAFVGTKLFYAAFPKPGTILWTTM